MRINQNLLNETIAILSADIYQTVYNLDLDCGGNYQTTAQRIVELAKQFEKQLQWKDDDDRDYLDELERFEKMVTDELEGKVAQRINSGEFKYLLDIANRDIKQFDMEITVAEIDGAYRVDAITKVGVICSYAFGIAKEDVAEAINKAWADIRLENQRISSDHIVYRKVHGWTHDLPAFIYCNTSVPLFFYDEFNHTIESVDDHDAGIDDFEGRTGYFVVLDEDYDIAMQKVEEHDAAEKEHH
jgi:hypothetical protein